MSYSTALPLTLPSLTSDRRHQLLEEQPLLSLYEVFATIPDPRSTHGLRYELAYLLICEVSALLCNCDSTLAVAQWCRDQHLLLIRLFGPRRAPRAQAIPSLANSCHVWMPNRSNARWPTGSAGPCKPNQMIPLPEMARRFVGPAQLKGLLPICSPFALIRVRKPCCKSWFRRKPMRSPSHRHSCPACQLLDGS
jgi:hypothetical protein